MLVMSDKKRHPWGARLRRLRKLVPGLTQAKLCDVLGLPLNTLRNWEQGRNAPPEYVRGLIERTLAKMK